MLILINTWSSHWVFGL